MSRYDVELQIESDADAALVARLRQAAETVLRVEGVGTPAALTILLTGNERLQDLNRLYRGLDEPTDVLSFPAGESFPEIETYLGDIAISVPMAERQAAQGKHTLVEELVLLVVHGVLHLLGYDDVEPSDRETMWGVQRNILRQLGEEKMAVAQTDNEIPKSLGNL
jgi:probable rRNA maturation factor